LQSFGSKPGAEDLKSRGTTCPICQDEFKEPILLSCKVGSQNVLGVQLSREQGVVVDVCACNVTVSKLPVVCVSFMHILVHISPIIERENGDDAPMAALTSLISGCDAF
jgi:hypothetical protein